MKDIKTLVYGDENRDEWLAVRKAHVTSSNVAALWNASPYLSYLELWSAMVSGEHKPVAEHERMKFGRMLEPAIGAIVRDELGVRCVPYKKYLYHPELRIGSSFDWRVHDAKAGDLRGWNIEIKNVDGLVFYGQGNDWHDEDGDIALPVHIELQVHHQMLVGGFPGTMVAVMVGGNRLVTIPVERDEEMCERILEASAKFWDLVDRNDMPDVDYSRDAAVIIAMARGHGEREVDLTGDEYINNLARRYYYLAQERTQVGKDLDAIKAEILHSIGPDVARVHLAEGFTIPCKQTKDTPAIKRLVTEEDVGTEIQIRAERQGFRYFRVNHSEKRAKQSERSKGDWAGYPQHKES